MNPSQIIDLSFKEGRHWFKVWRYATEDDFFAALRKAGIDAPKDAIAYTACYPYGDEAGAMYLLDKSVNTLAHEAVHMALGILSRHGEEVLPITSDVAPEVEENLCYLVGSITSELYSQSKYF